MNVHVVELGAYTKPEIIEDKRKDYIAYGADNLYFNYLVDRYLGSTTNQAIIDGKSRLIYGKGLNATDSNQKLEQFAKLKTTIKDNDLKKAILDRVMLGMCSFLVSGKGNNKVITHWPMDTLRAEKADDKGEIKNWLYHPNWAEYRQNDKLKAFPAYDSDSNVETQILVVRPYVTGSFYYPIPAYGASLPYAVLEEEIGDYLVNDTVNGFSGTRIVNFNNGVPSKEDQKKKVQLASKKLTGAAGQKVIFAFNKDETKKTTVDNIPLDNAPEHYRYLSEECEAKLLKGHKSPSALLGFNKDNSGFGNNAEELKNKMVAFDNYEIKPFQSEIIEALNTVLNDIGISLNLYFKTIEPLEFMDTSGMDKETKEEETGISLSSMTALQDFISLGEDISDDWEMIDERDVDYELEDEFDKQVSEWELADTPEPSILKKITNLISTGTARPNVKSEQDEQVKDHYYRVRYKYSPSRVSANTRPFCIAMVAANKMYRKEDIISLKEKPVNPGWGPSTGDKNKYSIWKYKGGGDCHHSWKRQTFRSTSRFKSIDSSEQIGTAAAAVRGYRITNDWEVSVQPQSMPNGGFIKPNRGKG